MTTFWIIVAVLIVAAVGILAPALLRSRQSLSSDRNQQNVVIAQERLSELEADLANGVLSQDQFDQAKVELEQALLLDLGDDGNAGEQAPKSAGRAALVALVIAVPALTLYLYNHLGQPQLAVAQQVAHQDGNGPAGEMPSVEEMIDALVARLKENPEDAEGWFLLGRTYMVLKQYPEAVTAYETVYKLVGDEPGVILALADALAMAQDGNMGGRVAELVRKAVQIAPDSATALWLGGMVEEQQGNYTQAVALWRKLQTMVTDDKEAYDRVSQLIAAAERKSGTSSAAPGEVLESSQAQPVDGQASIRVKISLSPGLQALVGSDEILFVYARPMEGPKMPLAASRHKAGELPLEVTLSDADAMMPQMRLSNFAEVLVGARISRTGNAIAESGDLKGEVASVSVTGSGMVEVVIDTLVP
jgi:cytochrome c-type biogenesis protein CcmH